MDVLAYKHATKKLVSLPGRRVLLSISPLPNSSVEQSNLDAKVFFLAHGCNPIGDEFETEKSVQTLSRALDCKAYIVRKYFSVEEIVYLFAEWEKVQKESIPDIEKLRERLRKDVNRDGKTMMDGAAAHHAENASTYYGKPMVDLTVGQLAYFFCLKNAYEEFHIPDEKGNTKQATKQWLNSDD